MSWDSWLDQFAAESSRAPLGLDAIPQIRALAHSSLRNVAPGQSDIRAQCPLHISTEGVSQTLRINLDPGSKLGIGFFTCYRCKRHGHWNELAEAIGIDPITGDANPVVANLLMPVRVARALYTEPEGMQPWPLGASWMRKNKNGSVTTISPYAFGVLEAKVWKRDELIPARNAWVDAAGISYPALPERVEHEIRAWLPVMDRGFPVAHVAALLSRRYPEAKKYKNSYGEWSKERIAFLEQVSSKIDDHRFIVLVEGPADALRLIDYNIPAVPLLGVSTWTASKSQVLASTYESAIVCLDGDAAGQPAQAEVAASLSQVMRTRTVRMPAKEDPASLPEPSFFQFINHISKRSVTHVQ